MGSWLVGSDGCHNQEDGITATSVNTNKCKASQTNARLFQVQRIPLTEELLEKKATSSPALNQSKQKMQEVRNKLELVCDRITELSKSQ